MWNSRPPPIVDRRGIFQPAGRSGSPAPAARRGRRGCARRCWSAAGHPGRARSAGAPPRAGSARPGGCRRWHRSPAPRRSGRPGRSPRSRAPAPCAAPRWAAVGPQATTTTSSSPPGPIRLLGAPKMISEAPVKPVVISTSVCDRAATSGGSSCAARRRPAGSAGAAAPAPAPARRALISAGPLVNRFSGARSRPQSRLSATASTSRPSSARVSSPRSFAPIAAPNCAPATPPTSSSSVSTMSTRAELHRPAAASRWPRRTPPGTARCRSPPRSACRASRSSPAPA